MRTYVRSTRTPRDRRMHGYTTTTPPAGERRGDSDGRGLVRDALAPGGGMERDVFLARPPHHISPGNTGQAAGRVTRILLSDSESGPQVYRAAFPRQRKAKPDSDDSDDADTAPAMPPATPPAA